MAIMEWIQNATQSVLDPNKELRVNELERVIVAGLRKYKSNFSIERIQLHSIYTSEDLDDAAERVFTNNLQHAWSDDVITEGELQRLTILQKALKIDPQRIKELQRRHVRHAFETALADAMVDGEIDAKEIAHLDSIASQIKLTASQYASAFLKEECEEFLRGVFLAAVNDGELTKRELKNLLASMSALGIPKDRFLKLIQPQATAFIEHVLADAKSDGKISTKEVEELNWLVEELGIPGSVRSYIETEIEDLIQIANIEEGKLPVVTSPDGLELAVGEVVHFLESCDLCFTKNLASGPKDYQHYGVLILTDRRLIYVSDTKSLDTSYRSVIGHAGNSRRIRIMIKGKPELDFQFSSPNKFGYEIFRTAVALANQTKTAPASKKPSRHISRDVRQVIWTRYGGRCADCGANDYLEFDHIIPVAKGGSNSETNVQLLCRRCNLKKSDKI